ncbi:class I SAM-dependent methyltransferase [Dokdonella sp. MW10]|uniref:class I SAM-dependent methyltransferase n=1 Tax=Dokdonella sp. MW10 TaxID=2992926 RepID=UPI003F7E7DD5
MAKQGEIDYVARIGEGGAAHAQGKPFSDADCGRMLADLGGVFMVLPPAPARLLDLGCGSGWTSVFFARRGYDVTGQDIAPDMIALAEANRAAAGVDNLAFTVCDYESLGFTDTFDAAVFYDALHHAEDPHAALAGVYKALKPGGVLVTIEPGVGHAEAEHSRIAVDMFGVTERDMPPRDIVRMARAIGFRGARVYPTPKMLAMIQYEMPVLARLPDWLSDLVRWGGMGWLMLVAKRWRGGMVVLRK